MIPTLLPLGQAGGSTASPDIPTLGSASTSACVALCRKPSTGPQTSAAAAWKPRATTRLSIRRTYLIRHPSGLINITAMHYERPSKGRKDQSPDTLSVSDMSIMRVAVAGTGGLGRLIAHYIDADTSHHVVLLSRTEQPQLTSAGYQVAVVNDVCVRSTFRKVSAWRSISFADRRESRDWRRRRLHDELQDNDGHDPGVQHRKRIECHYLHDRGAGRGPFRREGARPLHLASRTPHVPWQSIGQRSCRSCTTTERATFRRAMAWPNDTSR